MIMMKPRYFQLSEFLHSDTALKKRIKNIPTWSDLEHIIEVASFMDDMRDSYGKAIYISSCFRSDELNKAVGGSKTSVHKIGYAVDFFIKGGKAAMDTFFDWVVDYLKSHDIKWDQLLKESNSSGGYWIHLGLYSNSGEQRKQIKTLFVR